MILILGGGLAGLSTAKHLGKKEHLILEAASVLSGHAKTDTFAGLSWDEGPHVSFTKSDYVKALFEESAQGNMVEQKSTIGNFYFGTWIDHPAQSNLYQAPLQDREKAIEGFLASRNLPDGSGQEPRNYGEWLSNAFGSEFATLFPRRYTRKYWTVEPERLGTSWVSERVYRAPKDEFLDGAKGPLGKDKHYLSQFRYAPSGGFETFLRTLKEGVQVQLSTAVTKIDLKEKLVTCQNGKTVKFDKLVSTIPLPQFLKLCQEVPQAVLQAADTLLCTSVALVDLVFAGGKPTSQPKYHWWYVYNEELLSTRISAMNQIRGVSDALAPAAFQAEVYYSREKPLTKSDAAIVEGVKSEISKMCGRDVAEVTAARIRHIPYANVVFTLETKGCLDTIFTWLEGQGLAREHDDLSPITNWKSPDRAQVPKLALAGRYGQWKYFWTDDCVLRGQNLAERLLHSSPIG